MAKSALTKRELVELVLEDSEIKEVGLSKKKVSTIISKFIDKLKGSIENLDTGERIELRGLGTFGVKQRKARIARNPKTGAEVNVTSRKSAYFKPGREMKEGVRGKK